MQLKDKQQYRKLPKTEHQGRYVISDGKTLLNIASNDYLGLGSAPELQTEFFDQLGQLTEENLPKMSATSSRLLTGNDVQLDALETELQSWYQNAADKQVLSTAKSVLVF
ncbi:hypothetical protein, partial [Salinibacterium sp. NG22]|uniref:hypothetical protein n=1 Tax=Salinibacterium sp. NG22 TaxID=2792040 RepID=UPI0018CDE429